MQTTLIDPFEINAPLPPLRPPMPTMSVEVDFEEDDLQSIASQPDVAPDSWSRVRCWCSED
jgi:hypothetical protein